jgi:hypothetical protein
MANLLLDRYQNGQHREVWTDLVALGAAVRNEIYYPEAVEVAAETMKRARHNVEAIIIRLEKLGYRFDHINVTNPMGFLDSVRQIFTSQMKMPFAQPGFQPRDAHEEAMSKLMQSMQASMKQMDQRMPQMNQMWSKIEDDRKANTTSSALKNPNVFEPPTKKTAADLRRFEKELGGPMPISLRSWYEHVGSVNLMGHHEKLNPRDSAEAPDPLVVYPYRESLEADYDDELEGEAIELALAPDDLHKANTSGGDPYSMKVPDPAADGMLLWEWHQTTFVDYLRQTFAWGGFPGWARSKAAPKKEIDYLKEGLLPI